jgi:hypothetical protein
MTFVYVKNCNTKTSRTLAFTVDSKMSTKIQIQVPNNVLDGIENATHNTLGR